MDRPNQQVPGTPPIFRPKAYWEQKIREEQNRLAAALERMEGAYRAAHEEIGQALDERLREVRNSAEDTRSRGTSKQQQAVAAARQSLADVESACGVWAAPWSAAIWDAPAKPPSPVPRLTRAGMLTGSAGGLSVSVPALLPVVGRRHVLISVSPERLPMAIAAANAIVLRILVTAPAGKLNLLLIDPVRLGQCVAGFLDLAEYSRDLITEQCWYRPQDIEQRLVGLSGHMALVTQKFLRTTYQTIEGFNKDAGEVAEPYRLALIVNFPEAFSEAAAHELRGIFENGARCGVYAVVVHDRSRPLPHGFDLESLRQHANVIEESEGRLIWTDPDFGRAELTLDDPPAKPRFEALIRATGAAARLAGSVQIPFSRLAVDPAQRWKGDSRNGLSVALGRAGAKQTQMFELGGGLAQNALVIGRPGSGKSNLLHVLIANLAATYSPDELLLYLIDFKEGVEFKTYALHGLPHARVIAIHGEREFGLSVLEELDAEMKRRGAEYRRVGGGQSVAEYRQVSGARLPRILLIVDEFQRFFSPDDRIAVRAGQLIDGLVKQGRAFGIHTLLSSQTLAGANTLPSSTRDQITVRIALQCGDSDSRLVLGENNPAARLLTRPGEAICNAENGDPAGNSFFQVAWFTKQERDEHLNAIRALASTPPRTTVFDGDATCRIEECTSLAAALHAPPGGDRRPAWIGEPVAIRPPTAAVFERREARNLLVVGRDEVAASGIVLSAMCSLLAHLAAGSARFVVADFGTEGSAWSNAVQALQRAMPEAITLERGRGLAGPLQKVTAALEGGGMSASQALYLVIYGLQRVQDLDADGYGEEAACAANAPLLKVLSGGPMAGIHVLAWSDTMVAVQRSLARKATHQFGIRVGLAMKDSESSELLNDTCACRLGPGRAYLSDDLRVGELEKFRPYEIPGDEWIDGLAGALKRRRNS